MMMTSDGDSGSEPGGAGTVGAVRGLALRQRLIESGLALIERSGAQGLSLREVARESGVSHMAPYGFFRSKNELLSAIAAAGFALFAERHAEASGAAGDSPRAQIINSLLAYVQFALERPRLLRLMIGGQIPADERCDELRAAYGKSFKHYTLVMATAMARGELRAGDPAEAMFGAWSLVHGFTQLVLGREFEAKLGATHEDIGATARRMIDIFLRGLAP